MQPTIAGPLNAQCGKCLYWEQHDGVAGMGECKRYPPQVVMVREADDAPPTASSEWPLTLSAAWCGEWIDQKYRSPQSGA
jgi:hypothetical protein